MGHLKISILIFLINFNAYSKTIDLFKTKKRVYRGKYYSEKEYILESERSFLAPVGITSYEIPNINTKAYQIDLKFKKISGTDSLGLVLPVGKKIVQVVLGGWSHKFSGISYIDNNVLNSPENITRSPASFDYDKDSTMRFVVDDDFVVLNVNGKTLSKLKYKEHSFGVNPNLNDYLKEKQQDQILLWVIKGRVELTEFNLKY